jgi:TonB-linked SusC/RagA family outer membrane protein
MINSKNIFRSLLILSVFLLSTNLIFSQNIASGSVSDAEGNALPGVSIVEMGTTNGTVTDFDGNFQLNAGDSATLIFSYIGYLTQEVGASATMNVTMQEDVSKLEEVVVVGYGTQQKKTLTGAVASISGEEINLRPAPNTSQLLMGQAAGLSVRSGSGLPGDDFATLRIRNFEAPLIIVDGIVATFGQVDPNDIENISILKDAAASIYGARAGNGVILITTKRGSDRGQGAKFTYNGTASWSALTFEPRTIGTNDYVNLGNNEQGQPLSDLMPPYLGWDNERKQVYDLSTGADFAGNDWRDIVYEDWTLQTQHNLSARGRSEDIGYFISVGFTDTESQLRKADYTFERYNIRTNLDMQLNDNLKAQVDMSYFQTTLDKANFSTQSFYTRLNSGKPTYIAEFPDESYASHTGAASPYSPFYQIRKDYSGTVVNRDNNLRGAISLTYDVPFISGLEITGSLNMEAQNEWNKTVTKQFTMYTYDPTAAQLYTPYGLFNRDAINVNADRDMELLPKLTVKYDTEWGDNTLNALFVAESTTFKRDYLMGSRTDPLSFEAPYLNYSSRAELDNAEIFSESARKSFVGRVNYSHKEKYLFSATMRADATARYSVEGRWGYFPSLSFGWRISEEDFMKDNAAWNNLKVRASYGIMGNDAVSNYDFLSGYNIANGFYLYDGNPYPIISSAGLANALITWETMKIANVGIEGTLWDGGLGFELDVFYRLREDILAVPTEGVPFNFGASLPRTNINTRDNRGFDLMLKHQGKIGSVKYEINPMISWARGKYVSWDENLLPTTGVDDATLANNLAFNNRYSRTGQWDDNQWGFNTTGFFTSQNQIDNHPVDADNAGNQTVIVGDLIFVDQNGDGVIDWKDQVQIGKGGMPKWNYSTWTNASWGNWSVSALFQGAAGYSINFGLWQGLNSHQSIPTQVAYDNRSIKGANGDVEVLRKFPPANNTGGVPVISNRSNDFSRIDAMYLRLKTLNIGYKIPKNFTDKLGLDQIQLYIAGNNVFTLDNLGVYSGLYDPEITGSQNNSYPTTKSWTTGLKVNF